MRPLASVVIATRNRSSLLPKLTEAIDSQQATVPFEIVFVDDASTDDTSRTLEVLSERTRHPFRHLRCQRRSGPAAARNLGWRSSDASFVVFTDDDCLPQAGWLAAHLRALDRFDLAQGRTLPDPAQLHLAGPLSRSMNVEHEDGFYATCNMSYRRQVLERAGGFDETFRTPYGEDVDLAWRLKDLGAVSGFSPEALVYHQVWPFDIVTHFRDMRRLEGAVHALASHPHLRGTLHRSLFLRPSHPPALLAAGGLVWLAGSTMRPGSRWPHALVAVASGLPYLWHRGRHPLPGTSLRRPQWLAVLLASDLCEAVVLTGASMRHRTLML